MADCLIGLGANLGDRATSLGRAVALLAEHPQVRVVAASTHWPTPAIGGPAGQPSYLNAAVRVETALLPSALLLLLRQVETRLGRQRGERWAARTIDLDLLLYADTIVDSPELTVPHPRMVVRRFVLQPAAEIAAEMRHPATGWTIGEHLLHLERSHPYVAIAGPIGAGKSTLVDEVARRFNMRPLRDVLPEKTLATFYADPAAHAWNTELEFLQRRTAALAASDWHEPRQWAVSDFWYDQSLAYAAQSLDSDRRAAFEETWEVSRREIVRPRFVILLDAPTPTLLDRIHTRGRSYEQRLEAGYLDRLRREIEQCVARPDAGPVLRLESGPLEGLVAEVRAAVEATM
jgi:2-amino-4-hydroxy-6-hydroxymethyldihydropteridine diphosphokinase